MIILPSRYTHIRWDEEHAQAWVSESFTWTDRDSYLAWVTAWKAFLASRIIEIGKAKTVRRDPDDAVRRIAQSRRHYLRIECANLFLLRAMAKHLSAQQKNQRLTTTTPTG